ncbi:2,4-dienoyl-CoA reductase [NADPH] [Lachnospiraceae bacterium KM106-2]|nr:2,4-dienoyl-CoA reductase [NADPH] [Lachnospiraceae bacterium KM106-2]
MLIDMVNYNKIDVKTNTFLKGISETAVTVTTDEKVQDIEADTVILSVGFYADRTLYEALQQEVSNVWYIGDQDTPTNVMNAVADGAAVGFNI